MNIIDYSIISHKVGPVYKKIIRFTLKLIYLNIGKFFFCATTESLLNTVWHNSSIVLVAQTKFQECSGQLRHQIL
jgi:hypothetical protein